MVVEDGISRRKWRHHAICRTAFELQVLGIGSGDRIGRRLASSGTDCVQAEMRLHSHSSTRRPLLRWSVYTYVLVC
jgi:hypothetical protein